MISVMNMQKETEFTPPDVVANAEGYNIGGIKDITEKFELWLGFGRWDEALKEFVYSEKPLGFELPEIKKPNPEPEPEKRIKKIIIHEDKKTGIYTPSVNGLIKQGNTWKVFGWDRTQNEMLIFESKNLEDWSKPKPAPINQRGNYFQFSNGDIIFYREKTKEEVGGEIQIFDVSKDLKKLTPKSSYDWKLDGALLMREIGDKLYATGRVRGSKPKDEGGWGGDLPKYPSVSDIPQIEEAFDKYAPDWLDKSVIDETLKDRRGISLHTSTDNAESWSKGKIIAAPEDYDTPETTGWNQDKENGVGDFYASVFLDKKRMLVKLYKKEKNRVIEREAGNHDYPFQRRFRFTGETIIVPALYENGKVQLLDNESVIPREFHERKTPDEVPNVTCKKCVEVGQLSVFNTIEKDGYVYIFYGYRDDIHYESGFLFYAGLYIAKIPTDSFNNFFK